MGDQNKHYPFSASGAHRWVNCPASWQLEKMAPVQPSGEAARVGTSVHAMIEDRLQTMAPKSVYGWGDPNGPTDSLEGLSILLDTSGDFVRFLRPGESDSNGYTIPITGDMLRNAQLCIDVVSGILEKRPNAQFWSEYKSVLIPGQLGGTADIVIVDGDWGAIIDYKNGVHHVDVEDNLQLQIYALGVMECLKEAENVKNWTLAIVQPNDFTDSRPLRTWKTTTTELENTWARVDHAVADCQSENPPAKTGKWCEYCKASYKCPEQKHALLKVVGDELPDIPDFEENPMLPVPVGDLTDDQLAWVLSNGSMIKKYIDSIEGEALRRMQLGQIIPGFKMVESRTRRKVVDAEGLEIAANREGWDVWERKIAPLKKLDKEVPKAELSKYVEKPKGAPTWAPKTDKRPALDCGVGDLPELPEVV